MVVFVAAPPAGPVAEVVGGGALPSGQVVGTAAYSEQYVAAVRRNSTRQEIPVATVQRVSMTGDDADWQSYQKEGAAKSSGAADAVHAAEAVALVGAAVGLAFMKSRQN